MTLLGLRKVWSREDYEQLISRLSRLLSPFEEVTDFKINLQIPGSLQVEGELEPPEPHHHISRDTCCVGRWMPRGILQVASSFRALLIKIIRTIN